MTSALLLTFIVRNDAFFSEAHVGLRGNTQLLELRVHLVLSLIVIVLSVLIELGLYTAGDLLGASIGDHVEAQVLERLVLAYGQILSEMLQLVAPILVRLLYFLSVHLSQLGRLKCIVLVPGALWVQTLVS